MPALPTARWCGVLLTASMLAVGISSSADAAGVSAQVSASAVCSSQYSNGTFENVSLDARFTGLGPMLHYTLEIRRASGAPVQSIHGGSSSSGGMNLIFSALPTGTGESWRRGSYGLVLTRNADAVTVYTATMSIDSGCSAPTPGVNPAPSDSPSGPPTNPSPTAAPTVVAPTARPTQSLTVGPGNGNGTNPGAASTQATPATLATEKTSEDAPVATPPTGTPIDSIETPGSPGSPGPDSPSSATDLPSATGDLVSAETTRESSWLLWVVGMAALGLVAGSALLIRRRRQS